jgi:16S rRNA (cytosine1402-N4)-methyltransferase
MYFNNHKPVLIDAIAKFVQVNTDSNIFDGTFGGGGYSDFFLSYNAHVYACDLDSGAIDNYNSSNPPNDNLKLVNNNFSSYIDNFKNDFFDIIVADLGYSSNQLEFSCRGFSYMKTNELFDLRYDTNDGVPVYTKIRLLKNSSDLGKIIFKYSGETFSNRISQNLFTFITSTKDDIYVLDVIKEVERSIPAKFVHKKNAILSRVWQAMRVWVNEEFISLEEFLNKSLKKLKPNGTLMITCFNSLEDKIVTHFMRNVSKKITIDDFGNTDQLYELITKKAIIPSESEIKDNIRSRSATLRILKKL